jgi:hypothetical protein
MKKLLFIFLAIAVTACSKSSNVNTTSSDMTWSGKITDSQGIRQYDCNVVQSSNTVAVTTDYLISFSVVKSLTITSYGFVKVMENADYTATITGAESSDYLQLGISLKSKGTQLDGGASGKLARIR